MKVKVKSFNGELPEWLTVGKKYDVIHDHYNDGDLLDIDDDEDSVITIKPDYCSFLNGGSWEVVG